MFVIDLNQHSIIKKSIFEKVLRLKITESKWVQNSNGKSNYDMKELVYSFNLKN